MRKKAKYLKIIILRALFAAIHSTLVISLILIFFSLSPNLGAVPKTQSISPIFVILRELMEIYAKKVKKKSAFILIARNFFVPGPRGRRYHYPIFMKVTVSFWFYSGKLVWSNAEKYPDKSDKLFTLENIENLQGIKEVIYLFIWRGRGERFGELCVIKFMKNSWLLPCR